MIYAYGSGSRLTWSPSQVVLVVKNPPANAEDIRDTGLNPGSGRPSGGGHGIPLQHFLPGKPHGQRSLTGDSPRTCKEPDMTERLSLTHSLLHIHVCVYIHTHVYNGMLLNHTK